MPDTPAGAITVPISVGELIDKITILDIKAARITDTAKLANVAREREALRAIRAGLADRTAFADAEDALRDINRQLWDVEDALRAREAAGDFGPDFVAEARAVYRLNDQRAALKYEINQITGSNLVEEKSYETKG